LLVSLEMDGKGMTLVPFNGLPLFVVSIALAAHLVLGSCAGVLFFRSLWWNTRIMIEGGSVSTALTLLLSRFVGLGGLLTLAAFEDAAFLLATAVGVFIGRFLVLRGMGEAEP
jgi:F1F0 ATPase subunit 2